jgi:hypothetical protein
MIPLEKDDGSRAGRYRQARASIRARSSIPAPGSDVRELQLGRRSLRDAVILLARKLESLGVDVSDVTEMLGVYSQDEAPPSRASYPDSDALELVERNCLAKQGTDDTVSQTPHRRLLRSAK